ncbi:MAG: type IV pilus secretin PilQ [Acidobacteria bacterium]|nr:type IV pilus secretin PilQ [Acidobacteriota bacterium]
MRWTGRILVFLVGLLCMGTEAWSSGELLGLRTVVEPEGTRFLLEVPTPVQYFTSRIGTNLFLVDLAGISTERSAETQPVQSPLVSGYRLLNYEGADGIPHLALEITLKESSDVQAEQTSQGLQVKVRQAEKARNSQAPVVSRPAEVSIREISVIQPEDESTLEVEIVGDRDLETYRTLRLSNPDRVVVDIPNSVNRIRQKHLDVNISPLRAVRIAQFQQRPPVSRVVMDLDSQAPFQVRQKPNMLVVTLGDSFSPGTGTETEPEASRKGIVGPSETAETAALSQEASMDQPLETEFPSTLHNPFVAKEPVLLASNGTAGIGPVADSESRLKVSERLSSLPVAGFSEGALSAEQPQPTPIQNVVEDRPSTEAESLALAPEPATSVAGSEGEVLLARNLQAGGAMQAPEATNPAQEAPVYTGEPISLDLRAVDLKDFFRLIHEISGLNIVLDPSVSGAVTIVLDEVPWDQAMDIVLRNNSLGKEVVGNVVRVARLSTLQSEEEQRRDLARAVEQAQPRQTVTRTLSYARAADLIPTLKRFLSSRGDLVADARTNTLIITDIPDAIAQLEGLIGTLDRKSQQVEIEARIVAASRSFARDIGTQLAASGLSGNVVLGGTGLVGESPIKRGTVPPLFIGSPPTVNPTALIPTFANVSQPLLTNFPAVGATSGTTFLITGANFALDAILTAAESKGIGKLLSRPKVITQNHVEATVKQGVRIPIQTTINNTISIQFIDVVLRLTVKPQITADGTIFLQTDVENTTIDPGIARINGVPALDTQQATTEVLVSNGGTVFFGGVIQTTNNLTEQQVPLLGSIPLVGNLFKRRSTSTTTNELLFFITPRIVQS